MRKAALRHSSGGGSIKCPLRIHECSLMTSPSQNSVLLVRISFVAVVNSAVINDSNV